jgi:hypothetical protein
MRTTTAKRVMLGAPIATAQEVHHRLSKALALSVSSDAISSTAYATEEILLVLMIAGTASLKWAFPLSIAVAGLLAIVAVSYQQTVHAYPSGGGSYIVSTANLGRKPGMLAASSLMIDYVMTVAVSVAAGVAAIDSAFPSLLRYRVVIAVAIVVVMALADIRVAHVCVHPAVRRSGGRWIGALAHGRPPPCPVGPTGGCAGRTHLVSVTAGVLGRLLGHDRHRGDL